MRSWACLVTLCVALASGCDKEAAKDGAADAALPSASGGPRAPASAAPETPPAAKEVRAPMIVVDERGATIDGASFVGTPTEWQGRALLVLEKKARIDGEAVVINVMRDARLPGVAATLGALRSAKAKTAVVHTAMRDGATGQIELQLSPGAIPPCSVVAMIEHDNAVALWSKGGGVAQRFVRGMAGPDLSTSTEALRKRALGCDSSTWLFGAVDTASWGLVFDLATRARGGEGASLKPEHAVLLTHGAVPGRPVKED